MSDMAEVARVAVCTARWREELRPKLDTFGFAIIEPGPDAPQLDEVMAELGEPVEYYFGTKLALEPQEGSENLQFTTRGMPLHADSIFNAGPSVKFIGMQCVTAPAAGGETLISNTAAFFDNAPADLIESVRDIVVEYRNRIDGYYKDGVAGEHPRIVPVQVDPDTGVERLVMGFSDPEDPMRTHDAVVVGYSDSDSAELLRRIEEILYLPNVMYSHKWRVGQLMVIDNRRVLHGRAPFEGQARKLIRLSVA
ncbi:TauD/TfdA family dioxygenase [Nocardia sp. NPDC046763]|uniref:TauD/TfdA dioxygenase family protein n=1 Tax=Nocardia sp. NPDC046763 TaxID=3155256 RepID=UPI0033C798D5